MFDTAKSNSLSSVVPQRMKMKKKTHLLRFAPVKSTANYCINSDEAVHYILMLTSVFVVAKYLFKQFYKTVLHYSCIKPQRKGTKRDTSYADTGVLQTLSVDSALSLVLTNCACDQRIIHFVCGISNLDICLQVTLIACDVEQN